jgi:hypothetical protein
MSLIYLQAKEEAWRSLACDFNAQSLNSVPRLADQLRSCWNSIKKSARKNLAADKVGFQIICMNIVDYLTLSLILKP